MEKGAMNTYEFFLSKLQRACKNLSTDPFHITRVVLLVKKIILNMLKYKFLNLKTRNWKIWDQALENI